MHRIMFEIKKLTGKAQHEVAADIGISPIYLSHFFRGHSVSENMLHRILKLPYLNEHIRTLLIHHFILKNSKLPASLMTLGHLEKVANKVSKQVAAQLSKHYD